MLGLFATLGTWFKCHVYGLEMEGLGTRLLWADVFKAGRQNRENILLCTLGRVCG